MAESDPKTDDALGVWLIAESPGGPNINVGVRSTGQRPSTCAAWHVARQEGESLEDVIARCHQLVPIGTVLLAVADTDVIAASVAPTVTPAEPPRLRAVDADVLELASATLAAPGAVA